MWHWARQGISAFLPSPDSSCWEHSYIIRIKIFLLLLQDYVYVRYCLPDLICHIVTVILVTVKTIKNLRDNIIIFLLSCLQSILNRTTWNTSCSVSTGCSLTGLPAVKTCLPRTQAAASVWSSCWMLWGRAAFSLWQWHTSEHLGSTGLHLMHMHFTSHS